MDYKTIMPSQELRFKLLRLTECIPDKWMINLQYKIATNRRLDLKNPKRFTEKLQWYKLYYRDPLMTKCSDKYGVRDYIMSKGYEDILVPLYGVYDQAEDIDFDKLPERFVLKTTNGSHSNIFCSNKSKLDIDTVRSTLKHWLARKSEKAGREWAYYDIKPRIICEKFLDKDENNDLIDYKFFCFNGKPYCLYVIIERYLEDGIKLGIFDLNFNKIPFKRLDIRDIQTTMPKPKNFDKMVEVATALSKDFPHVRVDLYNIQGQIIFGELTFYDGCGYKGFVPDDFDYILGSKFELPSIYCNNQGD